MCNVMPNLGVFFFFFCRNITINSLKACFPYEHSFAEAVQNELVSIVKWLKLVHKQQKQPFTSDSPLPADLVIKVENLQYHTDIQLIASACA